LRSSRDRLRLDHQRPPRSNGPQISQTENRKCRNGTRVSDAERGRSPRSAVPPHRQSGLLPVAVAVGANFFRV
jgi:hypothetical protein